MLAFPHPFKMRYNLMYLVAFMQIIYSNGRLAVYISSPYEQIRLMLNEKKMDNIVAVELSIMCKQIGGGLSQGKWGRGKERKVG